MQTKTETRCCPTCGQEISTKVHINWPDAFNKFGYGDGDGEIYTYEIAEHIQELDLSAASPNSVCTMMSLTPLRATTRRIHGR